MILKGDHNLSKKDGLKQLMEAALKVSATIAQMTKPCLQVLLIFQCCMPKIERAWEGGYKHSFLLSLVQLGVLLQVDFASL